MTTAPPRRRFLARKIPRGQLYFEPGEVYGLLARHLPRGLHRGRLTWELEDRFRQLTGAARCVALPYARVAIHYLVRALGIPPGSEVLMTPITMPDIVNVLLGAGLRPVFVDLAPHTCNVDLDDLASKVTDRTKLVLVTHLCGFPTDMDRLMAHARRHELEVIEDCSQVIGARWRGAAPGLHGRAGVYSLAALKPVSTFCGALVITDEPELDARLRQLTADLPLRRRRDLMPVVARDTLFYLASHRTLFTWGTYYLARVLESVDPVRIREIQKGNLPLVRFQPALRREQLPARFYVQYSDCQAAIGLAALERLEAETRRRVTLATLLLDSLRAAGVPGLPESPDGAESVYWRFPLWVDDQAGLRAFLSDRYVDTATSGLLCASREEAFADLAAPTPEAFRFMDQMVFLPMHSELTEDDMRYIAACVAEYHGRAPERAA